MPRWPAAPAFGPRMGAGPYPTTRPFTMSLVVKRGRARMLYFDPSTDPPTPVAIDAELPAASYAGGKIGLFTYANNPRFLNLRVTDLSPAAKSTPSDYCMGRAKCDTGTGLCQGGDRSPLQCAKRVQGIVGSTQRADAVFGVRQLNSRLLTVRGMQATACRAEGFPLSGNRRVDGVEVQGQLGPLDARERQGRMADGSRCGRPLILDGDLGDDVAPPGAQDLGAGDQRRACGRLEHMHREISGRHPIRQQELKGDGCPGEVGQRCEYRGFDPAVGGEDLGHHRHPRSKVVLGTGLHLQLKITKNMLGWRVFAGWGVRR